MTDDGYGRLVAGFTEVHPGVGITVVNQSSVGSIGKRERAASVRVIVSPCLTAIAAGCKVVHAGFDALIAQVKVRPESIELGAVRFAEVVHKSFHHVYRAPKFVAQCKHDERRVIAVGCNQSLTFHFQTIHQ